MRRVSFAAKCCCGDMIIITMYNYDCDYDYDGYDHNDYDYDDYDCDCDYDYDYQIRGSDIVAHSLLAVRSPRIGIV